VTPKILLGRGGSRRKRGNMKGGETSMFTTLKVTKLYLDKVEKVEVEKLHKVEELDFAQRTITVWTEEGDKYELTLEAISADNLEFVEQSDWLEPTLYKPTKEE
jgi:hypothetical protein